MIKIEKYNIDSKKLKEFCEEAFEKVGLPKEDASIVADSLVFANLRGVHSHGVTRLKSYIDRVKHKVIKAQTNIKIVKESDSTALLDGGNSFGQVIGVKAMELAISKAKKTGIGFVGVRNSNHLGSLAYFTLKATKENMIGYVASNSSPAIAPWGGSVALFGTNPFSIAVPAPKEPMVVDMATTVVARGKIRLASKENKLIPLGWAMDSNGIPTTNAKDALNGTLVPIGDYKGANIILMIDILCGLLTGPKANSEVKRVVDLSGPTNIGNNFIAIDIEHFCEIEEFYQRMNELIVKIKNNPKAPGSQGIFIPGEIEAYNAQLMTKKGIPLSEEILNELNNIRKELDISVSLNSN